MGAYNFIDKVDSNKIFTVNLADLEMTLSPLFQKSLPKELKHNKALYTIANVNPSRIKPQFNDDDLVPYVGLPETDENTQRIKQVVLRPYKEVKGRNIIYPNDILFARIEPSIFNKKYIFVEDLQGYDFAFTSTEFYIIEKKKVDIKYIFNLLFTDYVYNQVKGKTTGSTGRRRLDLETFKSLKIPLPPLDIQNQIVEKYEKAYKEKEQKEQEAKRLLASIDTYLLNELGITLTKQENALKNRIFTVNLDEVCGDRLDAEFSQVFFQEINNSLNNTNYKLSSLKDNILFLESGSRPKGGVNQIKSGILSIGREHVNEKCEIGSGTLKYIPFEYHNKIKNTETKLNDIILVKDGATTGKIGIIVDKKFTGQNINEHVFLIRCKNDFVNPSYLVNYLHSSIGQILLKREITGATVTGLTKATVKNLSIIVPPIEKQNEIAEHITKIRAKAKELEQEAKRGLENTKQEIEQEILG